MLYIDVIILNFCFQRCCTCGICKLCRNLPKDFCNRESMLNCLISVDNNAKFSSGFLQPVRYITGSLHTFNNSSNILCNLLHGVNLSSLHLHSDTAASQCAHIHRRGLNFNLSLILFAYIRQKCLNFPGKLFIILLLIFFQRKINICCIGCRIATSCQHRHRGSTCHSAYVQNLLHLRQSVHNLIGNLCRVCKRCILRKRYTNCHLGTVHLRHKCRSLRIRRNCTSHQKSNHQKQHNRL